MCFFLLKFHMSPISCHTFLITQEMLILFWLTQYQNHKRFLLCYSIRSKTFCTSILARKIVNAKVCYLFCVSWPLPFLSPSFPPSDPPKSQLPNFLDSWEILTSFYYNFLPILFFTMFWTQLYQYPFLFLACSITIVSHSVILLGGYLW